MTESRLAEITARTERLIEETSMLARAAGTDELRFMAVTKNQSPEHIEAAYLGGARLFGENRVQSFREKEAFFETLEAEVHIIGHLQKNKVKYVVGNCSLIQSVDSYALAEKIGERAVSIGVVQDILIEVNTGRDESKYGVPPEQLESTIGRISELRGIAVKGIMTIPPIADARKTGMIFDETRKLFVDIKRKKLDNITMQFLSMGMSNDYEIAIKAGANLIRLGTVIFGR